MLRTARLPEGDTAMMSRILRHPALPALFVAAATPACTSPAPPVDTFVDSFVLPYGKTSLCPWGSQTEWMAVGTPTGPKPTTAADGTTQGGGRVTANCTVHPSGGGFDVQLSAGLSGSGSVTIISNTGAGDVTTTGGKNTTGTFQATDKGHFSASDCTISYMYQGGKVPANPPVAPGQIWGHLSCPDMTKTDVLVTGPDGGTAYATCDGEADFLFEYCGQ